MLVQDHARSLLRNRATKRAPVSQCPLLPGMSASPPKPDFLCDDLESLECASFGSSSQRMNLMARGILTATEYSSCLIRTYFLASASDVYLRTPRRMNRA